MCLGNKSKGNRGDTPLSSALLGMSESGKPPLYEDRKGHLLVAKQLIAARCNADLPDKNGVTPLHVAASTANEVVMNQLIAARCDLDLQSNAGATPLFFAARKGHASVTKQLIEARCTVDLQMKDGFEKRVDPEGADSGRCDRYLPRLVPWYQSTSWRSRLA